MILKIYRIGSYRIKKMYMFYLINILFINQKIQMYMILVVKCIEYFVFFNGEEELNFRYYRKYMNLLNINFF